MSWSRSWHKHKADLLWRWCHFQSCFPKENSFSTASPTSALFLHLRRLSILEWLVFLRHDCSSYNRDFWALKYICRHPQAVWRMQILLEECKWHFAGCHWTLCLSCLCWKSTASLGSRTWGAKTKSISADPLTPVGLKKQTSLYIKISIALLAVEAECKAHKISILEKHQLLINTKYYVQRTSAFGAL